MESNTRFECCAQALLSGQLASDSSTDAGTAVEAASGRAAAAYALLVERQVPRSLVLLGSSSARWWFNPVYPYLAACKI